MDPRPTRTPGPPNPFSGWATNIETLQDAIVVPATHRQFHQEAGVLYPDGSYCASGALWRKDTPITTQPPAPGEEPDFLPGRWVWGGVLWHHFGHFIVESSSRLWGLPQPPEKVDGILFTPKSPRKGDETSGFQSEFFRLAGTRPKVLTAPMRVEELIVPGQGFGIGRIILGSQPFRDFFHDRFAADIAPDGPDRLYISRSAIGPSKGTLICEKRIEEHLAGQGYEIFHPQQHDIATQVARYRAARQVIAAEGSAIHMFGLVARAPQKLAVLIRRRSVATKYIERHIRSFARIEPLMVDEVQRVWRHKTLNKPRFSRGEPDLAAIQTALAWEGFVDAAPAWPSLSDEDIRADLNAGRSSARDYEPMQPRQQPVAS